MHDDYCCGENGYCEEKEKKRIEEEKGRQAKARQVFFFFFHFKGVRIVVGFLYS